MPTDDTVPDTAASSARIVPLPRHRRSRGRTAPDARFLEADLVAACCRGDRRAMGELYERYRRRVFSLVVRIAGHGAGEELSQEVFLKIYKNISKFRGDSQLGTWIYRLAVNTALTYVTRRPRRVALEEAAGAVPSVEMRPGDPALRARMEAALGQLPPGYRAVLVLHDVEGLHHDEIAEILGCRVGTSKSQLHKARQRMRELLGSLE